MRTRWIVALALAVASSGIVVACGDDSSGGGTGDDAGGTDATADTSIIGDDAGGGDDGSTIDANGSDSASQDASADGATIDASDAGVDSGLSSVTGIWQGTQGTDYANAWAVLVGVVSGAENAPPGATVGVITYPNLGCGGPLTVADPDAGLLADAGVFDDRDGGDAGVVARLVLHETVSASGCVDGDDYFTLLSDGSLRLEWINGERYVGSLTRNGTSTGAQILDGVWGGQGGVQGSPLLAAVTRADTNGANSGVFLLGGPTGARCGGMWTLTQGAGTGSLTVSESFPEGQVGCDGVYGASLSVGIDGGATYNRAGVQEAGASDGAVGPYTLDRLSP